MARQIKAGTTDVSVVIRIVDSTDGTPETGVVFNTAGIDLQYRRELAASVAITEATLAALTTAHTDGGFLHIGNGYYRLDLPDAACATGATGVLVHGTVTSMVVIGEYIELVAYDPQDTVRLGLTALPNAAAEAAGGLYTRGTGAGQINQPANGQIDGNVVAWLGTAAATPTVAGVPEVDATHFGGVAGTFSGGRPEVNTSHVGGTLQTAGDIIGDTNDIQARLPATLVSGRIDASVGAMAANVITAAAVADGAIDRATFAADTGLQAVRSNTAQAGGATSITLDASASATTDFYKHCLIYLTGGTGVGQFRPCTAYNGTTKVATVTPAWATNPDATSTFAVLPAGAVNVEALGGDSQSLADIKDFADAGYDPATNKVQGVVLTDTLTTYTGNTVQTGDAFARLGAPAGASVSADVAAVKVDTAAILTDTGTTLDNHLTDIKGTGFVKDTHSLVQIETFVDLIDDGTSGLAKIATDVAAILVDTGTTLDARIPAALVGGRMDASVGAMANNVVTAAAIADGAIDRATFAADTGLQSVRSNTAQAGGATSITLDAAASATTDFYKHCLIYLTGGTGAGQYRPCTAYNGTTKVATVTPAWATNPDVTSTFAILPAGAVNVEAIGGDATSLADLKDFADAGYDPAANKVQGVVLVDTLTTYTGNTPQTGDSFARIGATGSGLTSLAQASVATEARLAELDAANIPADVDQLKADNPSRPTRAVQFDNFMFMMVDATDLNTPETSITVTATISKDGGAFTACTNAVSEVSGGWYKITLTATEMTADSVALKMTGTGCAQRNVAFRTQPT